VLQAEHVDKNAIKISRNRDVLVAAVNDLSSSDVSPYEAHGPNQQYAPAVDCGNALMGDPMV
jgi:hypothetical protein